MRPDLLLSLTLVTLPAVLSCQSRTMTIEDYEPRSTLVVPEHPVTRARYPFIDVHSHHRLDLSAKDIDGLVTEMDRLNMAVLVNLSGRQADQLAEGVRRFKGRHPSRFVLFANLDFADVDSPAYGERAAAQLARDVEAGAQGLKIFKNLGMTLKDGQGRRIAVDDPRFDPIWEACEALGIPVLIHTAEPKSFFEPQDYLPSRRWFGQFEGRDLDEGLRLKREIRTLSGATLSSRSATDAVRRALALHRVLNVTGPGH